jgi:hypothetical protein
LLDSLQRRANENLRISDDRAVEGLFCLMNIDNYMSRVFARLVYFGGHSLMIYVMSCFFGRS